MQKNTKSKNHKIVKTEKWKNNDLIQRLKKPRSIKEQEDSGLLSILGM